LIFWVLLASPPAFSQTASSVEQPTTSRVERDEWSLVRPTPMVTLHIRKLIGWSMLVPAGTLFMLYLFRPRQYVIAGAIAWAAGSGMLLVVSFDTGSPTSASPDTVTAGRLAVWVWCTLAVIVGASLRLSSSWFRAPSTLSRPMLRTLAIAIGWIAAGALLLPRPVGILAPAFALMTWWLLASAYAYLRVFRRYRFIGAAMAGLGTASVAIVNITAVTVAVINRGIGDASSNVVYFNFISAAVLMLGMHFLIFEDLIEELRRLAASIEKSRDDLKSAATMDPLTGCYNRRFLYEIADHELEQHRRYELPLSLLYIDIDHFKAINDTRGHKTGDEVLVTLGAILREMTRQADFVFRWGGDEFLVLLSATEPDARIKAGRIRQAFLESAIVTRLPDGVDLSIGCVVVPPETTNLDPLIDQADREMYRRKRAFAS
jgi:diguanylate cyclase (GGDEF)-like protein